MVKANGLRESCQMIADTIRSKFYKGRKRFNGNPRILGDDLHDLARVACQPFARRLQIRPQRRYTSSVSASLTASVSASLTASVTASLSGSRRSCADAADVRPFQHNPEIIAVLYFPHGRLVAPSAALRHHVARAAADLLDVATKIHGLRQQRIHRHGVVELAKLSDRHSLRQPARAPDFQPVPEQHHLDARVHRVVAMADGVDNSFEHNVARKFILRRHGGCLAVGTRSHPVAQMRHDEMRRLVGHLEHVALVNLMVGHRLLDIRREEPAALYFRRTEEPLRTLAEKERGGIGDAALVVDKLERGKKPHRRGIGWKLIISLLARIADKCSHLPNAQVFQLHPGGLGGIKWQNVDESLVFKIVRKRGIDGNAQFIPRLKTLARAFGIDAGDKCGFLLLAFAVNVPDET